MKYLHIDTETTGLDSVKNGIIQISGIIEIDGKEVDAFDLKIKPFPEDELSEKALEINKIDPEVFKTDEYLDPIDACEGLTKIFDKYVDKYNKKDKFILTGYRVKFDKDFLISWFNKCNEAIKNNNMRYTNKEAGLKFDNRKLFLGSYMLYNTEIDVFNLAAELLKNRLLEMKNFQLMTVAEYFGVLTEEELSSGSFHDAMFDIVVTKRIYDKIKTETLIKGIKSKLASKIKEPVDILFELLDSEDIQETTKTKIYSEVKKIAKNIGTF